MPPSDFLQALPSEAGISALALSELNGYFDTQVAIGALPGHLLLLLRGDKLVHAHLTGYADWETKRALDPEAIFSLFSMTKPFTAVAMLLLYEDGRWQFDDPVSLHLPEFADIASLPGSRASRPPTLREIFTHSAGFSFGKSPAEIAAKMEQIAWHRAGSLSELIGRYAAMPLDYEPGTSWEYSGSTDLLAAIVERMTGERFDHFLDHRVFQPLGMADTGFVLDPEQMRRLAPPHIVDRTTGKLRHATDSERLDPIFPSGGSSFKSTALDFARFARMLLNRGKVGEASLLRPETVELLWADHRPAAIRDKSYRDAHYVVGGGNGHGLNALVCVDPARAQRPVGRGTYEWSGAYGTWFWIDPEHDIACVGMTNCRRLASDMRPGEVVAQELVYRDLTR